MRINLAGVEGNLEVGGRGEEPAELWEPPLGWAAWRRATARGRGAGMGVPAGGGVGAHLGGSRPEAWERGLRRREPFLVWVG